jgi:hypothetical protein
MRLLFSLLLCSAIPAAAMLMGCSYTAADDKPAAQEKPGTSAKAALAAQGAEGAWGSIKGQIVYGGDVPDPKEIDITKDPKECKEALKCTPLVDEEWVVNKKNKGVRWVFVWIAQPPGVKAKLPIHPDLVNLKEEKVVMDQPCCHFEPHCLAVREGQTWAAKNSAVMAHNVKWEGGSDNPGDNPILPAGKELEITDLKASLRPITVNCSIHPWMKAWVRVFNHPYYAITDADGNFEIKDAPAGDFRLYIWHEGAGWVHKGEKRKEGEPITIKAGEILDLGKVEAKP